jgi:hypothetical protein
MCKGHAPGACHAGALLLRAAAATVRQAALLPTRIPDRRLDAPLHRAADAAAVRLAERRARLRTPPTPTHMHAR